MMEMQSDTPRWDAWVREVRARIASGKDVLVMLSGEEGNGKSTAAWHLSHAFDPTFNVDRMTWTLRDFITRHVDIEPGQALVMDEAVNVAMSRNAMSRPNKRLSQYLMAARMKRAIMFVCYPRLVDFDRFMQDRSHYWIHVADTGAAILRFPSRSQTRSETWWFSSMGRRPVLWKFGPASGPAWEEYERRKEAYVRDMGASIVAEMDKKK